MTSYGINPIETIKKQTKVHGFTEVSFEFVSAFFKEDRIGFLMSLIDSGLFVGVTKKDTYVVFDWHTIEDLIEKLEKEESNEK